MSTCLVSPRAKARSRSNVALHLVVPTTVVSIFSTTCPCPAPFWLPPLASFLLHLARSQILTLTETLRASQASLETARRREAAALSELERYDLKEASRVEQVKALLASACGADGGKEPGVNDWEGGGHCSSGQIGMGPAGISRNKAACTLSELAALEEAIAERAREIAALKVAMLDWLVCRDVRDLFRNWNAVLLYMPCCDMLCGCKEIFPVATHAWFPRGSWYQGNARLRKPLLAVMCF